MKQSKINRIPVSFQIRDYFACFQKIGMLRSTYEKKKRQLCGNKSKKRRRCTNKKSQNGKYITLGVY